MREITAEERKWIDLHNSLGRGNEITDEDYLWMDENFSEIDWIEFSNGAL